MNQKSRFNIKSVAVVTYFATVLFFVIFSAYMVACKDNNVYSARNIASYQIVDDYSKKEIQDASAPVGVRNEYSFKIGNIEENENCLIFYIVHSFAEVRFNDELIYSMTLDENSAIGNSPSSNWVVVPLNTSDVGKTVTVTITPVYKSVVNREVEFEIGSRYSVFMHRLKLDLPQIILSSLCIIMGILLIIVQIEFIVNKRTSSYDMLYLGIFALILGIWRITDTRFSPIIFENSTAALGYVTLSALFILAVPPLLLMDERHNGKFRTCLCVVAILTNVVVLGCFMCQVFGIAELREMLTICHITQIIDIGAFAFVSFLIMCKDKKNIRRFIFLFLIVAGSVADFIKFYIKVTSSGMIFTLIAFLVYTVYLFVENILIINKKAYVDGKTKLYNKARWDMYLKEDIPEDEIIGIIMLDLNGLKHTNDTYGHKMGDKMIVKFAEILRNTFLSSEFLCRWGGDEFTVVVRDANSEKIERYLSAIRTLTNSYNSTEEYPKIYFAGGYVLSTEFPKLSRGELLAKADERMYKDKKEWYKNHKL